MGSDDNRSLQARVDQAFREYLARRELGSVDSAAFVAEQDRELRPELTRVLADYQELRGLLEEAAFQPESERTLGDFRLVREIGRGGMGTVWEAEQLSLGRRVALKLLHPSYSLLTDAVERFEREAEAGGRVDHPAIVGVHAVGVSEGVHYIAMELIPGGYTLSDEIRDLHGRVELPEGYYRSVAERFATLADALEAAHAVGVVHRDIKPSNILLTEDGRPKIADFGVARIAEAWTLSRTGHVVGTYGYMSPEQAGGKSGTVDARTDVFSLGATLYEAMTLARAFEGDTSQQVIHKVMFQDPPHPRRLRSRVPGELAVICLKALEKNPSRRYASMADLAADLRRFLRHEPIAARPPGPLLRAGKWSRRHPALSTGIAAGAAGVLALSAFAVALVRKTEALASANLATGAALATAEERAEEAKAEAEEARRQRLGAERVADFLVALFEGADPSLNPVEITAKEVLDRGAARIADDLEHEPLVRARLMEAMGRAYLSLGLLDASDPLLFGALDLRLAAGKANDLDGLNNRENLAILRLLQGRFDEAEEIFEQVLNELTALRGEDDVRTLHALQWLAQLRVRQGRIEEAEEAFGRILDGRLAAYGPDHRDTLHARGNLAAILGQTNRLDEALPHAEELVERFTAQFGDEHEDSIVSLNNLAVIYRKLGRLEQAVTHARRAFEASARVFGPRHRRTWNTRELHAMLLSDSNDLEGAERELRAIYGEQCEVLGELHPDSLRSLNQLAMNLSRQERYDEVEALNRRALDGLRATVGTDNPQTEKVLWDLADMLHALGRSEEAAPFANELFDATPETHAEYARRRRLLAEITARLEAN